jgi:lipoyl(octanoyl) transferase
LNIVYIRIFRYTDTLFLITRLQRKPVSSLKHVDCVNISLEMQGEIPVNKVNMENQQPATCLVCQLGLISFPKAMKIERHLLQLRFEEKISDILLILEHPPTVTLGKYGNEENILLTPEELDQQGIAFYHSDRGGDATFNCTGQLVVHPIINLRLRGARAYIADLEEMCLLVLQDYDIAAERSPQHPGVWINGKQIVAIGLRYSRGISMHGLSFNINPDLIRFQVINLCGHPGKSATSIENEIGHYVSMEAVIRRIMDSFSKVFKVNLLSISKEQLKRDYFDSTDFDTA